MFSYEDVYAATLEYFNGDDLAANVFVTKYALKDKEGNFLEKTPDDMHKRLAREFARIETNYGGNNALGEKEIYDYFKNFKQICTQGSPMFGIGNKFVQSSLSNCTVVDQPQDNMSSIFDQAKDLANLFKRRAGCGIDISTLRPEGASVNNAALSSSGAWSFSDLYSFVSRMIGQNGRRAALMISMDVRHPDIEKFIVMKQDLTKVTGANISVKITDKFMEAVQKDSEFVLQWPVDAANPKYSKIVKAKQIWNLLVDSATNFAEPGLLFWDTIKNNLPANCYDNFKIITTNPCGELPLSGGGACRLIAINLKSFVDNKFEKNAKFNFKNFDKTVGAAQRMSDDLVDLEIEKIEQILSSLTDASEISLWNKMLDNCKNGRETGLGTYGLADAIACLCLKYDSDEAIKVAGQISETMRNAAYSESIELARQRGTFPAWDWEVEKDNLFIKELPNSIKTKMQKHGRRNIALLTNAPTGSVSILSQVSSGIEPVFRNSYTRRKKLNQNETHIKPDFVDKTGDKWISFEVVHHNVKEWQNIFGSSDIPDFFITSDKIEWKKRIQIQSIMQKYVDHSISNTINLPKGTGTDLVGKIYFEAWKQSLKGITIYVDGSRDGILVSDKNKSCDNREAPKRPEELPCQVHHVSVKGQKWLIMIGLLNEKPYEIFGGVEENIEIPKKFTAGRIVKVKEKDGSNRYDLYFGEDGSVKDIAKMFNNTNYQVHTRLISLSLRHGAKPNFLVEQLLRDSDNDLTSFSRAISRVLKKHIEDGTKVASDKVCSSCGQETLEYRDSCITCSNCGWSKCS